MKNELYLAVAGAVLLFAFGSVGHAAKGGDAGGASADHRSASGQENTNAQSLPGSERGLERATERMSDQGLQHQQAPEKAKNEDADVGKKAKKAKKDKAKAEKEETKS